MEKVMNDLSEKATETIVNASAWGKLFLLALVALGVATDASWLWLVVAGLLAMIKLVIGDKKLEVGKTLKLTDKAKQGKNEAVELKTFELNLFILIISVLRALPVEWDSVVNANTASLTVLMMGLIVVMQVGIETVSFFVANQGTSLTQTNTVKA